MESMGCQPGGQGARPITWMERKGTIRAQFKFGKINQLLTEYSPTQNQQFPRVSPTTNIHIINPNPWNSNLTNHKKTIFWPPWGPF